MEKQKNGKNEKFHKDLAFSSIIDGSNKRKGYSSYDNPEDLIINREKTGELLKGLDSLTKREQDILRLIYWNGMSYLEVASVLNISESRVGQVHNKSLKKLKKVLTNE